MKQRELANNHESIFESLRHHSKTDIDYWLARELFNYLGYTDWRNFERAVDRAKITCTKVGLEPRHHFVDVNKMVTLGSTARRNVNDMALSKLACYLIAENADPRIKTVAEAKLYFAVKTHLQEQFEKLTPAQKRIAQRNKLKDFNKNLFEAAKNAGVVEYAQFYDAGLKGLYGGLGTKDIKSKKGINDNEDFLDCIGNEELAINAFRVTQTEAKIKRECIKGDVNARNTHNGVGKTIRSAIEEIGGTMPEELQRETSIKELEKNPNKQLTEPML